MIRMRSLFLIAILACLASSTGAGTNEVLKIGDTAPVWEKLPGVDDKLHSSSELKDKAVTVVVFTCNSCDYSKEYEDRIQAFAQKHAGPESKVALVAINVNKVAADLMPKMKERTKEKGFTFPYLFDDSQKIAKEFGANWTPEFFVLNRERKVVYMGAMDDSTDRTKVIVNYVEAAVEATLKGESPAKTEIPATGCRIRWARERK